MKTVIRNSYTPKTGDYCETIVVDKESEDAYIFDCDGIFTPMPQPVDVEDILRRAAEYTDETVAPINEKLDTIEEGAQVNVIETITQNGQPLTVTDKTVNVTVPTNTSDLVNDGSDGTDTYVESSTLDDYYTKSETDTQIGYETTAREIADSGLQEQIDAIVASSDVVDIVGTYAALQAYDTTKLHDNDIIKVLADETRDDAITYYRWQKGTSTWAYIGAEGPFYTKAESDATFVPQTRTVNGKALSANISLTASDVGALPDSTVIPTVNDATLTIQKNGTNVATFTANSATNATANISVPTDTSDLTNGAGFITSAALPTKTSELTNDGADGTDTYAEMGDLPTKTSDLTNDGADGTSTYVEADELATVATTGDYDDLLNKPTIPTVNNATLTIQKNGTDVATFTANSSTNQTANIVVPTDTSDLTNGAGFITSSALSNYYTKSETYSQNEVNSLINSLSIPTKTSDLINDSDFITLTDIPTASADDLGLIRIGTGLSIDSDGVVTVTSAGSVDWDDITNKPTDVSYWTNDAGYITSAAIPTNVSSFTNDAGYITSAAIPTNVSAFTNDAGYLTSSSLSNYYTKSETYSQQQVNSLINSISIPTKTSDLTNDGSDGNSTYVEADDLAAVATSGSYNDLLNKPTIPTIVDMTGATSSTAGAHGYVPAPAAGDQNKFLQGDGTWATPADEIYTAGNGINIDADNEISVDTTVVATQTDLAGKQDTLTAGSNMDITSNVISAKVDSALSASSANPVQNSVVKAALDGKATGSITKANGGTLGTTTINSTTANYMEVTKLSTATDLNTIKTTGIYIIAATPTNSPTGAWGTMYVDWTAGTKYQVYINDGASGNIFKRSWNSSTSTWTSWVRITSADIANIERFYRGLVPLGTAIAANKDLNTTEFLKVGKYYCSTNATVATLTNCPTGTAFMMEVFSPLSTTIDNETTGTWVYRMRVITELDGDMWYQGCNSNATANNWTYGAWRRVANTGDIGNATLTIQKNGTNVQTFTANATSNKTANITVPTKVSELTSDAGGNMFVGTCNTAAGMAAKTVTVSSDQNFALKAGVIVAVKFTNSNTASNCTLEVNSTSAKTIYYNGAVYTGSSTWVCGGANQYVYYIYDGTYWVWLGMSLESNTTYSTMSVSEGTTGTATNARTMRADYLKQIIDYHIRTADNLTPTADTTAAWKTVLGSVNGHYYTWYSSASKFTNQPSQYGFLETFIQGNDIYQRWHTQSSGPILYRSGNGSGWSNPSDGSWNTVATTSQIPTVNDATLTIQKNGSNVATFTANSATNQTANISVPNLQTSNTDPGEGAALAADTFLGVYDVAPSAIDGSRITDETITPAKTTFTTYSTTEKAVGEWIDGKTIYRKTIDVGALPNNASKNTPHGISNLDTVIDCRGFAKATWGTQYPIPTVYASGDTSYNTQVSVDATNVTLSCAGNNSSKSGYVTIWYTKSS